MTVAVALIAAVLVGLSVYAAVRIVLRKQIDHVDTVGRAFIAASPFLVLATGSSQGLDCSPKGDKPGFVQVEDDGRTLLIPDRVSTDVRKWTLFDIENWTPGLK